jgi:DNA-binding beta-propeller fold protein YncE
MVDVDPTAGGGSDPGGATGQQRPLLVVTAFAEDAVHLVDVVARAHVGYVAAPGTIAWPRGVAATLTMVAVSAWKSSDAGHGVHLFAGRGASWCPTRVVGSSGPVGAGDGQLNRPYGLRLTTNGAALVLTDLGNQRVSVFRAGDGAFIRHVVTGMELVEDVEECKGGWLAVACDSDTVWVVSPSGDRRWPLDRELRQPAAVAWVPGLGAVVREAFHGIVVRYVC